MIISSWEVLTRLFGEAIQSLKFGIFPKNTPIVPNRRYFEQKWILTKDEADNFLAEIARNKKHPSRSQGVSV